MAGTVVTTEETYGAIQKIKFAWTSSADTGAADATTTKAYCGIVERCIVIPGTVGTQPTNLFDVAITDGDSVDVLLGQGANLSNAATSAITANMSAVDNDLLTLSVTNAGNSKTGTVILYVR